MRFCQIFSLTLSIYLAQLLGASPSNPNEDLGFAVFRDRCMACHLQTGMGIKEMNAPSIAGLPRWYVTDQLRKFRRDQRGFHDDDSSGHLMQLNAMALDEKSIAFVGRHIESLITASPGITHSSQTAWSLSEAKSDARMASVTRSTPMDSATHSGSLST